MSALAEPRAEVRAHPAAASRAWMVPALLLTPCLIWICFFFLAPLALMCWRSLASEEFSLEPYTTLFTSPLYTKVMLTTVKTASIATVGALVLAYPIAYVLTPSLPSPAKRVKDARKRADAGGGSGWGKLRGLILVFVLIPYWVDIIVRSFSWLILLGDNGIVNKALIGLGIVSTPLQLLYNPFSVLLAMVQILLPLTTVTLFGAMLRIDRTLMAAAKIHGANEWRAFRTVFFPLSLPGVYGAGLLVFVLALGFYVTPALLGSPRETMIAQTIMVEASQLLDWPQASAAGAVLLVITTAIATIYNRYFSLDRLWGGADK
jgi:putative spermidine/putrescine transport system permease protein